MRFAREVSASIPHVNKTRPRAQAIMLGIVLPAPFQGTGIAMKPCVTSRWRSGVRPVWRSGWLVGCLFGGWLRRFGGLLDTGLRRGGETSVDFPRSWIDLKASIECPQFQRIARAFATEATEDVAACIHREAVIVASLASRRVAVVEQLTEWAEAAELITTALRWIPRHPVQKFLDLDILAKPREVDAHGSTAGHEAKLGRLLPRVGFALLLLGSMLAIGFAFEADNDGVINNAIK